MWMWMRMWIAIVGFGEEVVVIVFDPSLPKSQISSCNSFEYAVVPCRTLCCGKIFCTEHLADVRPVTHITSLSSLFNANANTSPQWLHGPNAEGRCPNCENACSLEGGTLSLATPSLKHHSAAALTAPNSKPSPSSRSSSPRSSPEGSQSQSQSKKKKNASSPSSRDHHDQPSFPGSSPPRLPHSHSYSQLPSAPVPVLTTNPTSSSATSSPTLSTAASIDTFSSGEDEPSPSYKTSLQIGIDVSAGSNANLSTTLFSAPTSSWGAASRLVSIVVFLMLVYKVLS
ncbi:hypothetical protein CPB84DRAFT_1784021 [Gymnopilus junonius]|uniref:Uncharacterized protein n=1 Tax=Gymnopilus junonius TaxID=109634 RepID=A0A9P5NKV8_GYMJU|nr:hypothetical protein CPB84DRAFT_1784021 [Gymnopilus junonius]